MFVSSCTSFLGAFTKLLYRVLSVHMEQLGPTGWIFMKLMFEYFS